MLAEVSQLHVITALTESVFDSPICEDWWIFLEFDILPILPACHAILGPHYSW